MRPPFLFASCVRLPSKTSPFVRSPRSPVVASIGLLICQPQALSPKCPKVHDKVVTWYILTTRAKEVCRFDELFSLTATFRNKYDQPHFPPAEALMKLTLLATLEYAGIYFRPPMCHQAAPYPKRVNWILNCYKSAFNTLYTAECFSDLMPI